MGLLRRTKSTSIEQVTAMVDEFELPSFPQVATAALQELGDPDVDLRHVAEVLEKDPGLSVHFLRLANSASFGLRSSVDSLDRAVAMLGRNQVESILIGRAVHGALTSTSPVVEPSRYWATAATRAVIASRIAMVVDPARRSEHFTAGLLQDMAILVLVDRVKGYDEVLAAWYGGDVATLAEAEAERYGWDHADVGGAMCTAWQFPPNLVEAVASHHHDGTSPSELVQGWHETDPDRGPEELRSRAAAAGLVDRVDEILDGAQDEVAEVAATFG